MIIFFGLVATAGIDHTASRAEAPARIIAIVAVVPTHTAGDVGLTIAAAVAAAARITRFGAIAASARTQICSTMPVAVVAAAARAEDNHAHLALQAVARFLCCAPRTGVDEGG